MIIIEYAEWGEAVKDVKAEDVALWIHKEFSHIENFRYPTSTSNLITAFRMLIAEGVISHNDIVFKFGENTIQPLKDGSLSACPNGFADVEFNMLCRIMNTKG